MLVHVYLEPFSNILFYKIFYGWDYETIDRTLATDGLCGNVIGRHATAFSIRMDGFGIGRSVFGCERIHVGAHETALFPYFYLCYFREFLFPRKRKLPVHQKTRNTSRNFFDSYNFLHLQRRYRKVSRLGKHHYIFRLRRY